MIRNKFKDEDLSDVATQGKIIRVFVDELAKPNIDKLQCSIDLLNQLFQQLSFNFKHFLTECELTELETEKYVSYILYTLYYYELPLGGLAIVKKPLEVEYLLLALAVESLDTDKSRQILENLSVSKQLRLVGYCSIFVREGTWKILNILAALHEQEREWQQLHKLLRTKYYDPAVLYTMLAKYPLKQKIYITSIIDRLEEHAKNEILTIQSLLPLLVNALIHSPLVFSAILKMSPDPEIKKVLENSKQAHENLKEMFKLYSNETYSLDELNDFFRLFGLKGHVLNNSSIKNPYASLSLLTISSTLLDLFKRPQDIPIDEYKPLILFVLSICQQLHSFHRQQPSPFKLGLSNLVFALSTRGINLPELPWLESILQGINAISEHLHEKGDSEILISMNPIVIFDQAESNTFEKNEVYIKGLSAKYKIRILHLSIDQTLYLADKLGIKPWIKTSTDSHFGYGGARNCALLLAPMIAKAFTSGISTIEELGLLSHKKLKNLYQASVLGKGGQDLFVHLGEDDVAVPICNIFSDALFADACKEIYFNRPTQCIGRTTHEVFSFLDLKTVLESPQAVFFAWKSDLFWGAMKGMLTKPKFCLPIPIGNEELHVMLPAESFIHFLQPNIHFAGTRYPYKAIPSSPFDGIVDILSKQLPYSLNIAMAAELTDAGNENGRNIFPWNDKEIRQSNKLHNLNDLWAFASSEEVTKKLRERFWNNLEFVFKDENTGLVLRRCLSRLIDEESTSPHPLINYYKGIQQEARLFVVFAQMLIAKRKQDPSKFVESATEEVETEFKMKISETSLTKGFLALINAIENFGNTSLNT